MNHADPKNNVTRAGDVRETPVSFEWIAETLSLFLRPETSARVIALASDERPVLWAAITDSFLHRERKTAGLTLWSADWEEAAGKRFVDEVFELFDALPPRIREGLGDQRILADCYCGFVQIALVHGLARVDELPALTGPHPKWADQVLADLGVTLLRVPGVWQYLERHIINHHPERVSRLLDGGRVDRVQGLVKECSLSLAERVDAWSMSFREGKRQPLRRVLARPWEPNTRRKLGRDVSGVVDLARRRASDPDPTCEYRDFARDAIDLAIIEHWAFGGHGGLADIERRFGIAKGGATHRASALRKRIKPHVS